MSPILFAQIEPTTRCNFTCGFCVGRTMRQGDLPWAAFEGFLAAHPRLRHVELQGEGEPLLHRRFFDMAAAARARGIAVSLITNGSLLDEAMVERLLAAGITSIHVSMESADPAEFRRIRGGKFAKVRDGLALLARRRREMALERPVIGLAVTVLKDTLEAIHGIYDLYVALGLDGGIVAQPLQTMPAYARAYDPAMAARVLGQEEAPRFAAVRAALRRQAPVRRAEDFFYSALFAGFDPARHACPWLARGAYLGADGAVAGCCFMKDGGVAPGGQADERRAALVAAMEAGTVPAPCAGCGTARAIAAARQSSVLPAVSR